jgi:hypothetical protein
MDDNETRFFGYSEEARTTPQRGEVTEPRSCKLFLSWSGKESQQVAVAFNEALLDAIPRLHTWMSTENLQGSEEWFNELRRQLCSVDIGIVFLTGTNQSSCWLNLEAGAFLRLIGGSRGGLCPVLLGITELPKDHPLSHIQAFPGDFDGFSRLFVRIAQWIGDAREPGRLKSLFRKLWPDLQRSVKSSVKPPERSRASPRSGVPGLSRPATRNLHPRS